MNTGGKAEQGTGMWSILVPIVVVIVEQAVAVPAGWISPFEIWTAGGAALTDDNGTKRKIARETAILKKSRPKTISCKNEEMRNKVIEQNVRGSNSIDVQITTSYQKGRRQAYISG